MKITEGGTGSRHHAKAVGDADDHLPLFSLKGNTSNHEKNSHGLFFVRSPKFHRESIG